MSEQDILEPGTHVFSGTIKSWNGQSGELVTDSGLTVVFVTDGKPVAPVGSRVTLSTRRFRPRYYVVNAWQG